MGVTFRSIIIGLILIPLNALWLASMEVVWISGQSTTLSLFYHVIFILFWLVLANLLLGKLWPERALKPPELLTIYTMLSIASALNSLDFASVLLPMLPALAYLGPLETRYEEVAPHVPDWLVVNDANAVESYYIGQESFYDWSNLQPWLEPVAWWLAFILALCAVMWGLILVFRKQWTEHEKLAYPIIEVPMRLTTGASALLRNKVFWCAFGAAGFIDLINGLNVLYPFVPKIPIVHIFDVQSFFTERPWSDMGPAYVSLYPFAIGMAFFMPLDLAFSCWFFFLFWKLQRVMASHIGMQGVPGFPFVEEQTAGGYYAMALIALWVSRSHLKRVAGVVLGRSTADMTPWDRREARIAVALILAGGAFLMWFSLRAGMSAGITLLFFVLYFLISLAVTRMRAELGPPSHDLHHIGPNHQIIKTLGPANMAAANVHNVVMLGFYNFFNRAYRGHPMPHGMEGFRIAERMKMRNQRALLAMAVAIVAGAVCAFWALLVTLNYYGAAQISALGTHFGREAWNHVDNWLTAPEPARGHAAVAILVGLLFCNGLYALRMALPWWPLHPVGYAISGSWSMEQLWLCIFVAWLVKTLILKYGSAQTYKSALPFFTGLILGEFIVGGFWNLYGTLMGVRVYHFWPY